MGIFWKCARIGERLSPYMSICCVVMAVSWRLVALSPYAAGVQVLMKTGVYSHELVVALRCPFSEPVVVLRCPSS